MCHILTHCVKQYLTGQTMLIIPLGHAIRKYSQSWVVYFDDSDQSPNRTIEEVKTILPGEVEINHKTTIEELKVLQGQAFLIKNLSPGVGRTNRSGSSPYIKSIYKNVKQHFLDNPDKDIPVKEMNKLFSCGIATMYQVINKLIKDEVIYKFYKLNMAYYKLVK